MPQLSNAPVDRAQLAKDMAAVCVLRGTFTLRSGRVSNYYLDKYLFSTRPEVLRGLGDLFAVAIAEMEGPPGRALRSWPGPSWAAFRW